MSVESPRDYDVVVVGASLAGCTAARLYGERGLKVALVERRTRIDDYKRTCTHFIQPCAVPVTERLGLAPLIEEAGAVRNRLDTWTRWGWIQVPERADGGPPPYGYSIRRETLDPIVRRLSADTDGVKPILGRSAVRLANAGRRVSGVVVKGRDGAEEELTARLVVAADGRDSAVAEMAGVPARVRPNNRFAYFAYYRGLELTTTYATGQAWLLEPDFVIAHQCDTGAAVVCAFVERSRLSEFKNDPEGSFRGVVTSLPMAPDIDAAERISPLLGKLAMPNTSRRAAVPGLAFVGDAAMAADPLWAVGCGWAFLSASWLVDSTAEQLLEGTQVDRGLRRYRRRHRAELRGFYLQSCSYSTARQFLPHEKLILSSAAKDRAVARRFTSFGEGLIGLSELLSPRSLGRALWVLLSNGICRRARQSGSRSSPRGNNDPPGRRQPGHRVRHAASSQPHPRRCSGR